MTRTPTTNALGRGVYSLSEAARLTDLRTGRVRDWFRTAENKRGVGGVFKSDYPSVGDDRAISFLDLIEVYIAGRLREASPPVSLQHIRKVHQKLSIDLKEHHPFCTQEIYHSKGQVFTRPINSPDSVSVIEPLTDQAYINAVIMPFLKKIEYDSISNLAKLWRIADGVVIDPSRCFGKPISESTGIATRVLASAFESNGRDANRVAGWYEIDIEAVEAAVRFESRPAA
jgi:uncharacterized protein (DUF433 family)